MKENIFDTLPRDAISHLIGFFDRASLQNWGFTNKSNYATFQYFKLLRLAQLRSGEQTYSLQKIYSALSQMNLSTSDKESLKHVLVRYNNTPLPTLNHVAMGLICLSYCQPLDDNQIRRLQFSLRVLSLEDKANIDYLLYMLTSKDPEMRVLICREVNLRIDESCSIPFKRFSANSQPEFSEPFPEGLEARKQWTLARLGCGSPDENFARTLVSALAGRTIGLSDGVKALTLLVHSSDSREWGISIALEKAIPLIVSKDKNHICDLEINPLFTRLIQAVIKFADEMQQNALLEIRKKLVQDLLFSSHDKKIAVGITILIDLIHSNISTDWAISIAIENFVHLFTETDKTYVFPKDTKHLFFHLFKAFSEYANNLQWVALHEKILTCYTPEKRNKFRSLILLWRLFPLFLEKMDSTERYQIVESMLIIELRFGVFLRDSRTHDPEIDSSVLKSAAREFEKVLSLLTVEQRKRILIIITTLPEYTSSINCRQALLLKAYAEYADEKDIERIFSVFAKTRVVGLSEGIVIHQLCLLNKLPHKEIDRLIIDLVEMMQSKKAVVDLDHAESGTYALLALLIVKFQPRGMQSLSHQLLQSLSKTLSKNNYTLVKQALLPLSLLLSCLMPISAEHIDSILSQVCIALRTYNDNKTSYFNTKLFSTVFNAIYSRNDFNVSDGLQALIKDLLSSGRFYFTSGADISKTAEILLMSNQDAIPLKMRLLFPYIACDEEMFKPLLSKVAYKPKQDYSRIQFIVGMFSNINSETALRDFMFLIRTTNRVLSIVSLYCGRATEIKHLLRLLEFMHSVDVLGGNCFIEEWFGDSAFSIPENRWDSSYVKRSHNCRPELLNEPLACSKLIRDRILVLHGNLRMELPSDTQLLITHFLARLKIGADELGRKSNLEFIFWCIEQCDTLEELREFRYAIFDVAEHRALFAPILDSNGKAKVVKAFQARMSVISQRWENLEPLTVADETFLSQTGSKCTIC